MTIRRTGWLAALIFWPMAMGLPTAGAHGQAVVDLQNILTGFRRIHGISMRFICKKKLAVLKHPFISGGSIAMMQPDRVRFATDWPYRSCFILRGTRVYIRTQDNRHWRSGKGSGQQVVQRVMQQFASWSLGHAGDIAHEYHIMETIGPAAVPSPPRGHPPVVSPPHVPPTRQKPFPKSLHLFILIPKSRTMHRVIRSIQLGFSPGHHQLLFIEMRLAHGNESCYWLGNIRINPHFSIDEFRPKGQP